VQKISLKILKGQLKYKTVTRDYFTAARTVVSVDVGISIDLANCRRRTLYAA